MSSKTNIPSWILRISIAAVIVGSVGTVAGSPMTTLAAMNTGEVSTLHAALFIATVWIVSSLRINRLKALWRVGLGLKWMRGASGYLLPRGPKARAATGAPWAARALRGFPEAPT
ncbi:hypothetical protein [Mesorhizobium amorphae]|uniref:hypothetical protein n=1 Tax=Mesorhizobium amorphae TaxID=71433 RepID=UPI001FF065E0|nr:hypothetical protein [Mesorhizobium amorphae]